jgi:hypothetical protein
MHKVECLAFAKIHHPVFSSSIKESKARLTFQIENHDLFTRQQNKSAERQKSL